MVNKKPAKVVDVPQFPIEEFGEEPDVELASTIPATATSVKPPVKDTSIPVWAILSFALGISSLFFWVGINAIGAVIAGHIALKKLKALPEDKQNKVFSIVGLTSGYIGIALFVLPIIATIAGVVLLAIVLWIVSIFAGLF